MRKVSLRPGEAVGPAPDTTTLTTRPRWSVFRVRMSTCSVMIIILPPSINNLLSTVDTDHAAVHEAAGGGEGPHDAERGPGLVHAGPQQVQTITSTQTLHQQFKLCALALSKLLLF